MYIQFKRTLSLSLVIFIILFSGCIPVFADKEQDGSPSSIVSGPGKRYIVKYNESVTANKKEKESTFSRNSVTRETYQLDESPSVVMDRIDAVALELNDAEVTELQADPRVEYIEEDTTFNTDFMTTTDSDAYRFMNLDSENYPWGFTAVGGDASLLAGYKGKGIKIAVLDTGVSPHPDLSITGGTSFVEGTSSYADDFGHGTHVAGTIAALNNNIGTIGIAPEASLYAVKVLDRQGNGYASSVIQGIQWAIENHMNIISMSFGAANYNQALHEAIQDAAAQGILLIASAGNRGLGDETENYPARYPEVISVGAVNKNHLRAAFSSTGNELDLVAPGTDILSTTIGGDYGAASGTSMAAPHVTGAAAVIWARNPDLTSIQIKTALLTSATSRGSAKEYGAGIINLPKSLSLSNAIIPPVGETDMENTTPLLDPQTGDTYSVSLTIAGATAELTTLVPTPTPATGNWNKVCTSIEDPEGASIYLSDQCKLHDGASVNLKKDKSFTYTWAVPAKSILGTYKVGYTFCTATACNYKVGPNTFTVTVPEPANVSAVIDQKQIKVSWTALESKYGVSAYNVNVNGTTTKVFTTEYSFNADPGSKYTISVSGRKDNVDGTYSRAVEITVPSTPAKPNSPSGLAGQEITPTSLKLTWNNVTGATSYYVRKDGQDIATVQPGAGSSSYPFNNLNEATRYSFSVASYNSTTQTTSDYTPIELTTADYGASIATAFGINGVSLGGSIAWNGKIQSSGDYDLFRFRPLETGRYEFKTSGTLDVFGSLYNSSYQLLEENDDSASGDSVNFRLMYDLQAGTDYYLEISSYNDISTGSYRIDAYSYIDDYRGYADSSATGLSLNTEKSGLINYTGDVDMFRFNVSQAGIYRFSSTGSTDVIGVLLDQNGVEVDHDDDSNGTLNFQIETWANQGDSYYLMVRHYNSDQTGSYGIRATLYNNPTADVTPPAAPTFVLSETKLLTINYSADSNRMLYSLNNADEYTDYTGPFPLAIDTKVYALAIDSSGNSIEVAYDGYTKDKEKPSIPANLSLVSATPTSLSVKWNASTDNVAVTGYEIYNGSALITTVNVPYVTLSGLRPNTSYVLNVTARDAEGNISALSSPLNVMTSTDVTPPSTASITLSNTQLTNTDVTVTIVSGIDSEAGVARSEFKLGTTGSWETYNGPFKVTQNGIQEVFARTVDLAGNKSAETSAIIRIDKIAPNPPAVNPAYHTSYQISGTAESYSTVYVKTPSTTSSSVSSAAGLFSVNIPPQAAGTELYISSIDAAGNSSAATKITILSDNVAPSAPSGLTATVATCSSVKLTWSLSTDNVGVKVYEIYNGTVLVTTTNGNSLDVTGLRPLTAYNFTVKAKDSAGNLSAASNNIAVTTLKDTTVPGAPIGLFAASRGSSSFVLQWTASVDDSGIKSYNIYRYLGNSSTLVGSTSSLNYFMSGLTASATYTYFVKAVDFGDNLSVSSDFFTITIDGTPPTIPANLAVTSSTASTATFSWNAASDANGIKTYTVYNNGSSVGTSTGTSIMLTGLKQGTTYNLTVKASDSSGNISAASSTLVYVHKDIEPPTTPANLTVSSKTSDSLMLTWTASTDNVRVLYYDILVDGIYKGTSTSTAYTVTGLTLNTSYKITVKANDGSGNTASSNIYITLTP